MYNIFSLLFSVLKKLILILKKHFEKQKMTKRNILKHFFTMESLWQLFYILVLLDSVP